MKIALVSPLAPRMIGKFGRRIVQAGDANPGLHLLLRRRRREVIRSVAIIIPGLAPAYLTTTLSLPHAYPMVCALKPFQLKSVKGSQNFATNTAHSSKNFSDFCPVLLCSELIHRWEEIALVVDAVQFPYFLTKPRELLIKR
jgi:hypothetical protein